MATTAYTDKALHRGSYPLLLSHRLRSHEQCSHHASVDRTHSNDITSYCIRFIDQSNLDKLNDLPCDEISSVGFTDFDNGNYRLTTQSPYHNVGTDGKDPGPDWGALDNATRNTVSGTGSLQVSLL